MSAATTHPFSEGLIRVTEGPITRWVEDPEFRPQTHTDLGEETGALTLTDLQPDADPPSSDRPADPSPAMQALHDEARELEQLADRVVLSRKARGRLAAIPGELATLHRAEQEKVAEREALAAEFGGRLEATITDKLMPALRAYLDARDEVSAIQAEAFRHGMRPTGTTKLEVRAQADPELRGLLARLRGSHA